MPWPHNPLHTEELRNSPHYSVTRRTGRTTAIALRIIAQAIEHPYEPQEIRDHVDLPGAHKNLVYTIADMINRLDLKEMYVSIGRATLMFGNKE